MFHRVKTYIPCRYHEKTLETYINEFSKSNPKPQQRQKKEESDSLSMGSDSDASDQEKISASQLALLFKDSYKAGIVLNPPRAKKAPQRRELSEEAVEALKAAKK